MAATDMPAIRVRGLGRYFGPRVEMDGAVNPREAFRTLMRIARRAGARRRRRVAR